MIFAYSSDVCEVLDSSHLVVYIDTGSLLPGVPSKSRDLADDNFFFDGMEMIRNNRITLQLTTIIRS
jgi:hypothetical protein